MFDHVACEALTEAEAAPGKGMLLRIVAMLSKMTAGDHVGEEVCGYGAGDYDYENEHRLYTDYTHNRFRRESGIIMTTKAVIGGMVRMHDTTRAMKRPGKPLVQKRGSRAISPRLQAVLDGTEDALRRIYGGRFLGLVLFGSHAQGSAVQGSDIDLILLLRESEGIRERRHYAEVVAELSLRHDTVISLVPMDIEEFRNGRTPLLLNVRREGIRL